MKELLECHAGEGTNQKAEVNRMYAPQVKSAKPIRRYRLQPFTFVLCSDIEHIGFITYRYILVTLRDGEQQPCLYVASETNPRAIAEGDTAYFLGIFDGSGHLNKGASEEWGDLEKFVARALVEATQALGVTGTPQRIA
jgi:hypothetical protein